MNNSSYSDEYNRRKKNFEKGLIELDLKHIKYFKPRPPIYHSQKHDGIISHFMMQNSGTGCFHINIYSSDLPLEIKEDLLSLFDKCWKN